jgi:hypothetical protein
MKTSNKILLTAFLIAVVAMLTFITIFRSMLNAETIQGDNNVVEQQRNVPTFERIIIRGNFQVYFTQDDFDLVMVKTDSNLQEHVKTEVKGDELIIISSKRIKSRNDIRIEISNPNLRYVEANASAGFYTTGNVTFDRLELMGNAGARMELTGNFDEIRARQNAGSNLTLAGSTRYFEATSNAGGNINARELQAEFAKVAANAGANISVNALELDASSNAGGNIRYSGDPVFRNMSTNAGGNISRQN